MRDTAPPTDTPLMQDPSFAAALRLCGASPVILPGGLMILHRRILGLPVNMLPRTVPPDDLFEQLAAADLHRHPLILSPEVPCHLPRALRLMAAQRRAVLDLCPDPGQRIARLHPKWRNQWRKAGRAGLHLSHAPMPADPSHPLLLAEARQRAQRGYAGWPLPLTRAFAAVAPAQTRLFTARHGRRVVAQMLFLRHGAGATYHIGHTSAEGRRCHAHNLLLITACDWLAAKGHLTLDLGLLHRRTAGLNRFKQRSGARAQPTGGTWLCWHPLAHRRCP
ncbi:hypothetical protein A8B82_16590 [Sulfitobacter sp. EhC04]|uniref:GNAT family N-acetyltransferase n=1 Tax=Sulfitobacter sp. EhC04 TaxID=1849168 RepID=UPI0007F4F595|nr:GNAT family N-acetyltransferase [Sulfitobacter sp. EhC04]OAN75424.1 hypothetical protein A8B82_16590 [Sulfitobacter sp. EhC04]